MEILSQVCQEIIPQSPDVSSYLMVEYSVMGVNWDGGFSILQSNWDFSQ
jgi:hypothetical protein